MPCAQPSARRSPVRPNLPTVAAPLSQHPGAIRARRWRERRRLQRCGYVCCELWVSPYQMHALRRLGLLAGDPVAWPLPRPDADELARAVAQLLDAAEPLAQLGDALCPAT